jgi:hypothetical protein
VAQANARIRVQQCGVVDPASAGATIDEIAELKAALAVPGLVVEGSKGQPRPNGRVATLVSHRKLADQLVVALGLPVEGEAVGRRRSAQAKQAVD